MGEVLDFRLKETSASQTDKPTSPAEIFIFPGVRIERRSFSLADRLYAPTKSSARASCQSGQKTKE